MKPLSLALIIFALSSVAEANTGEVSYNYYHYTPSYVTNIYMCGRLVASTGRYGGYAIAGDREYIFSDKVAHVSAEIVLNVDYFHNINLDCTGKYQGIDVYTRN